MIIERPALERRILASTDAGRIPVVLGGCGTGRTSLLLRIERLMGAERAQYLNLAASATTPERCLATTRLTSRLRPAPSGPYVPAANTRAAFEEWMGFFDHSLGADGAAPMFLLDEALDIRTFESFPGLRHVQREVVARLAASPSSFVLASKFTARAHRLLRDATSRFEVMHLPPLATGDVTDLLAPSFNGYEQMPTDDRDFLGRAVQALTDGRAVYVRALGEAMSDMGAGDPISALTALLSRDGKLTHACRFCYELRLHRARGYGALKAILDILAEEEPLTLTEISLRLHRTPGSTKDYLSWLEDVDLVTSRQKRYSFTDPLLRLWVRLNCRPTPPTDDDVVREVQRYALARMPQPEPAPALAYAGVDATAEERKSWGIIEID